MFQPIGLPTARVVERIAAARNRDAARVARAGEVAKANGGNAMDAAIAATQAAFSKAADVSDRKIRVLRAIGEGAGSSYVRVRYGARLRLIAERLDGWRKANDFAAKAFLFTPESSPDTALTIALRMVEHWRNEEIRALRVAAILGRGSVHSLAVLDELRWLLRALRRSQYRDHLTGLIGFALGEAA